MNEHSPEAPVHRLVQNERANFSRLFKQTPEMVCILKGPEHVFEYVNEAHIKALGFDATGMAVRVAQPESVEAHALLDQVYTTGKTAHLHEVGITVSDRLRHFNLTYAPATDADGNVNGVMVLGSEVTAQVAAQRSVQEQSRILEKALAGATIQEILAEIARAVESHLSRNVQASITLLGYSSAEPSDKTPHWSTPILSPTGQTLGTFAIHHWDESQALAEERQAVGLFVRTAAVVIDRELGTIARKATEQELDHSRELLAMAVEVSKIGFYDWDIPNNTITYSPRMRIDWGLHETSQLTLEAGLERIHPEDRARVAAEVNATLTQHLPFQTEYRVVRADRTVWVAVRGGLRTDAEGKPTHFFGTSRDITEQKEREASYLRAQIEAERANQAKSAFLANMSHEIRTPLGAILGFTDLLKERDLETEERQQYLETISRNGKALTRIIDDILDLAKVESEKLEFEQIEFSLYDLLDDVMDLFRERTRAKGIYLRAHLAKKIPDQIVSDSTRLRQILINIVGNAVKFTEEGGVTIEVLTQPHPPTGKTQIEIRVCDTGLGISDDQKERLFQPFTQADNSTTRKYGGTGLGLVLSKRLAMALGGDIAVADHEPNGSTFTVSLLVQIPVKTAPKEKPTHAPSATPPPPLEPHRLAGVKVLLAEDSIDNQILIQRVLLRAGANVQTVDNGVEALREGMTGDFDVIIMDIQMPKMDGYGATKSLRKAGFKKPIIALTAHAMSEDRARTLAAGCNFHLTKPLDRMELIETIGSLVRTV